MDIAKIQTLITQGRVITDINEVNPDETFVQVGVYQPNNRKIGSGNADAYPSFVIALSDLISPPVTPCCPVTDVNWNLIIDDNSDGTVSVSPGSVQTIPNFSGMLIVNDHYDGRVETWIAGGGDGVLISFSNVGAGPCNNTLTMNGGAGGYDWTNVDNYTGPVTFTVIKTRNGS